MLSALLAAAATPADKIFAGKNFFFHRLYHSGSRPEQLDVRPPQRAVTELFNLLGALGKFFENLRHLLLEIAAQTLQHGDLSIRVSLPRRIPDRVWD